NKPAEASRKLTEAFEWVPYNADYAYRAATAMLYARADPDAVRKMLNDVLRTNPSAITTCLTRAQFELEPGDNHRDQIESDFQTALRLNPNDVESRLKYARVLEIFGQRDRAIREYELALRFNDQLDPQEPKRLQRERIEAILRQI